MALAHTGQTNASGNATTVTQTEPGSSGDLVIATIHVRSSSSTGVITITPPAGQGWTSIRKTTSQDANGVQSIESFRRTGAAASQSFTYSISAGTIVGGSGQMNSFSGHDTTTPIDVSDEFADAASANSVSCPSVTPTNVSTEMLLCVYAENGTSGAWTHPTGMTERVDAEGYGSATELLSSMSATGTRTATATTSRRHRVGQSILINPVLSTGATIAGAVANATLDAIAPVVSISKTITGVEATATLDFPAPSVLTGTVVTIAAVSMDATLDAPAPTVAPITPPDAQATLDAPAPTIVAQVFVTITATVASATLDALAPSITVGENIVAVSADEMAAFPTPTISIFFEFITPEETEAHMSTSLRQATPTTPDPSSLFVRVDGSGGAVIKSLLGVEHGIEPGKGTEVVHGELTLTLAEDMPVGSYTFTVKAIDEAWDASLVTYNTAPSVRATTGTDTESGLSAGDEVTIDITTLLDESVSLEGTTGQQWFGLELTVNGSEEVVFYGAYSVQYRPKIIKEVSRPPVAPFNMRPTSGLHVSELKPYFAWDFRDLDNEDTLSMIQFQLDTTDDFETPSYDSGEVASTTSYFDSNSPPAGSAAFANLTNGNTYYWRAKHADNHGLWSDWSEAQSFTVTTKGSLTVDPTPTVPTPTISWSLSVTQQAYYVLIERYEGGWVTHWEQPWTTGTTTEVTLPDAYVLNETDLYRRTVRVTDTTDRSDLPGDRSFYEDVEEFQVAEIVMA